MVDLPGPTRSTRTPCIWPALLVRTAIRGVRGAREGEWRPTWRPGAEAPFILFHAIPAVVFILGLSTWWLLLEVPIVGWLGWRIWRWLHCPGHRDDDPWWDEPSVW